MARKTKLEALETRQQILDAAVRQFSAMGVARTSLKDIATEAGVSRGAIYWHFKNKVELFNEVWRQTESEIEQLDTQYRLKFPADPLQVMRRLMIYILTATVHEPRRRALMEILFHKCEFIGEMEELRTAREHLCYDADCRIESILKECVLHKQLPSRLNIKRASIIVRAYMTGLMENWLFLPQHFALDKEATVLVDTLIDMFQNSPHLQDIP